ncbi:MAG: cell division protein FtsZ [Burkholderiales bacterium]
MGTLQLWLAVVGGLVLAAVVGHGIWQTRRANAYARLALKTEPAPLDGAGAAPGLREPSFGEPPAPAPEGEPAVEPAAAALDTAGDAAAFTGVAPPVMPVVMHPRMAAPKVDALIDAVAAIAVDQPVSGELVLAHLPTSRRAGGKSFLIEGLDTDRGEWEPPQPGRYYGELQAGLQLANRLGPLNEIEFSEFVQKIQAFADAIGAMPDFPDMLEEVARGRELDAFASEHDAQLAMRLQARRAAWPLHFVEQHAARHGFVAGATPGRLVLPSPEEGAPPMLALQFDPQAALAEDPSQARISEVTLAFDVPQTPPVDEPFNAWCAAGRALALGLDAVVSDDRGQALQSAAFPTIGQDLEQLYAQLAERDLAAGSAAARRLFS